MITYSLKKNLACIAWAYIRPGKFLETFLDEASLLYGLVPFLLEKALYELLYIQGYSSQGKGALLGILPIPAAQYNLYRAIFSPLLEAAGVGVFVVVLWGMSRIAGCRQLVLRKAVNLFLALSALGLLAFVADAIYFNFSAIPLLLYIHPLVGLGAILYMVEFIHRQAAIPRGRAFLISGPALVAFFVFRLVFFV